MARMMVGQRRPDGFAARTSRARSCRAVGRHSAATAKPAPALRDVSFEVRANEIVGIAGVSAWPEQAALALRAPSGGVRQRHARRTQLAGLSSHEINQLPMAHIPRTATGWASCCRCH